MIKQLSLYCLTAIFFMLGVGGSVTPLQAHCQTEPGLPHTGNHPHCTNSSQIYPVYDVKIDGGINGTGDILPGTGVGWVYDGKAVGSLRPRNDPLDMSYFDEVTFDTGVAANQCFDQVVLFGGFLRKHRKNVAEGMFWFEGTTSDSSDGVVLYLLQIEGTFYDADGAGFFPGNEKFMLMDRWTLGIEGGGEVSNRACEGADKFDSKFTVTFVEQP